MSAGSGRLTAMSGLLSVLVVLAALAASAGLGAPLVGWVLDRARRKDAPPPADPADPGADPRPEKAPEDVLRGGTWIGVLERLAVTGAVLIGYPAAIAVVIAVKGLGRFPELASAHGASERFIIGTLASLMWACTLGLGALWLLARV